VAAVAIAFSLAVGLASVLPQTWESQAAVQLGQFTDRPIERADLLVRRINVGTLRCGAADAPADSARLDSVTARLDAAPELGELRLIATARTADEAQAQVARAADCLVERHRLMFEKLQRRDKDFRAALQFQLGQIESSLESATQMLGRLSATSANAPEILLLQSRVQGERAQHLDIARQLRDLDASHQNDMTTSVIFPATRPSAPIWPRRALFGLLSGSLALVLCSAVLIFGATSVTKPA
jgi:uncharacterized protein involved in exopolysaccharide biosynthesis